MKLENIPYIYFEGGFNDFRIAKNDFIEANKDFATITIPLHYFDDRYSFRSDREKVQARQVTIYSYAKGIYHGIEIKRSAPCEHPHFIVEGWQFEEFGALCGQEGLDELKKLLR